MYGGLKTFPLQITETAGDPLSYRGWSGKYRKFCSPGSTLCGGSEVAVEGAMGKDSVVHELTMGLTPRELINS